MELINLNKKTMLKIKWWQQISWTVEISWSKNASLPIIAASLLVGRATLNNVPKIGDVFTFLEIIKSLNVQVEFIWNTLKIDSTKMNLDNVNTELIKKIRVGILLLPSILNKFGDVNIPYPGWCNIGKRPIDEHIKWFKAIWYSDISKWENVHLRWEAKSWNVELSAWFAVTATENLITANVLREWKTTIHMAAIEPHVINLIEFFKKAWADISIAYNHKIEITWVKELKKDIEFRIINDYIEAWTFVIFWALTSKEYIDINNARISDLTCFLEKCKEAWVKMENRWNDILRVYRSENLKAVKFQTNIFPGFPTDLQSPFAILLTQADWISKIQEIMFEWRLNYLVEIEKMKWHPAMLNPHEALIFGKTKLHASTVSSWDLRAWIAMIIAWLIAEWDTYITNVEYIKRWYEDIIGKMQKLWVVIEDVDNV